MIGISLRHPIRRLVAVPLAAVALACSDSTLVTPDAPVASVNRATRVTLTPHTAQLTVGENVHATAVVTTETGAAMPQAPSFRSSNMAVATVTAGGLVVARASGAAEIYAEIGTVADTLRVSVLDPAVPVSSPMNGLVQVRFVGNTPTAAVMQAFTNAAARLNSLMQSNSGAYAVPITLAAGQCDQGQPALNETVPGLLIVASIRTIDGPAGTLGLAGPCLVRTGTQGIPAVGIMAFDEVDMDLMSTRGLLNGVILHEMIHVLGIGTMWGPDGRGLVADPNGADPLFRGTRASAAYGVFGALNASLGVPVENTGGSGTRGGHWRETVFQGELMTGWANGAMQMSTVTLNALADMGYDVDVQLADAYSLPSLIGSGGITASGTAGVQLGEVIADPIATVDRQGKFNRF